MQKAFVVPIVSFSVGYALTFFWLSKKQKDELATQKTQFPSEILKFGSHGPVTDLLIRKAYVSSYNRMTRVPHWVAEHLTADSLKNPDGSEPDRHQCSFKEDKDIPHLYRARVVDYKGTEFDRGHMAPCGDIKDSQEAVEETFLLTNVSPQVGAGFNRSYWLRIESFVRRLTRNFDDVYVISGPLFLPKEGPNGKHIVEYQVIGDPPNIAVPTHYFKVILGLKGEEKSMVGFVVPNQPIAEHEPISSFILPIQGFTFHLCKAIEKASGLEFFQGMPRTKIENLCAMVKCELPKLKKNFERAKNEILSSKSE